MKKPFLLHILSLCLNKSLLTLFIFLLTFYTSSYSQEQESSSKNYILLNTGFNIYASSVFSGSSNGGPFFTTNLTYLYSINPFIYIGPRLGCFWLNNATYYPIALSVRSKLIDKKLSLNLMTSLGYAFSTQLNYDGPNWGGVYVNLGLDLEIALNKDQNYFLVFTIDYTLEETKRKSFFNSISSYMNHLLGFNVGLARSF